MTSASSRRGPASRARCSAVYGVLIYVFLFVPIVLLVLFSFNANRYGTFPITGWTFDVVPAGVRRLPDARCRSRPRSRSRSQVTAISTIVGTAAAFPLVRSRLRFRDGIRIIFILPIMIPGLLIGVSLLVLFTSTFHWTALARDGGDRAGGLHDAVRDPARLGAAAGVRHALERAAATSARIRSSVCAASCCRCSCRRSSRARSSRSRCRSTSSSSRTS